MVMVRMTTKSTFQKGKTAQGKALPLDEFPANGSQSHITEASLSSM